MWSGLPQLDDVERMSCGVLWFEHIAKSGGTSITTEMQDHARNPAKNHRGWTFANIIAPAGYDNPSLPGYDPHWRYNRTDAWREFEAELQQERPRAILSWHYGAAGLEEMILSGRLERIACAVRKKGCDFRMATVLREPMARLVSKLAFNGIPYEKLPSFIWQESNPQAKYLQFQDEGQWPRADDGGEWSQYYKDMLLSRARNILDRFDYIGQTENLMAFRNVIQQALGWGLTSDELWKNPSELAYRLNVADYDLMRPSLDVDQQLYRSFCRDGHRTARAPRAVCAEDLSAWNSSDTGLAK